MQPFVKPTNRTAVNSRCGSRSPVRRTARRPGAVLPLLALTLPVMIILCAFAINIAYLELARTEMYIVADAASRATGRTLATTGDVNAAKTAGRTAATLNTIAGQPVTLVDSDFSFGQATRPNLASRYNFSAGGSVLNGVEVTINRTTSSPNGAIHLLMPVVTGLTSVNKTQTSRSNQIEVDIALVLDRSGSMAYADTEVAAYPPLPAAAPTGWWFGKAAPTPCRWRDAVNAVDIFLGILATTPADEYVSLSTYNNATSIDTALSDDYDEIDAAMAVYTAAFNSGATNIGGGIDAGHAAVLGTNSRSYAAKVVIILTDGIDTVGSNPISSAASCATDKVQVFAITFAAEADQATMAAVAAAGNGQHYHAATAADLNTIFHDIGKQLPILISR